MRPIDLQNVFAQLHLAEVAHGNRQNQQLIGQEHLAKILQTLTDEELESVRKTQETEKAEIKEDKERGQTGDQAHQHAFHGRKDLTFPTPQPNRQDAPNDEDHGNLFDSKA